MRCDRDIGFVKASHDGVEMFNLTAVCIYHTADDVTIARNR